MQVNKNRCPQNHSCPAVRVCKFQAISQEGYGLPAIDDNLCINCGKCIRFCPMGAISE